jgi:hypothetical protein
VKEIVLVRNEKSGKLDNLWLEPYKILEIDHKGSNVVIELSKRKRQNVHINRLKTHLSTVSGSEMDVT